MSLGLQRGSLFAGRYRIVRRLGSGAMGSVYEVVHLQTERPCALKIMHAHIVEREEMRERFKMEAKVAARVGSEYIVDVLDAGVDETSGIPFFVMERLRGEDLSRRLKRVGRLGPAEAVRYLHQVSIALDRTHQASIVHRDLKPANLFLTDGADGQVRVKVLDFGVAKFITEATGGATTAIAGTPLYMSPEQCRGGKVTAAADVYALGMIAYTLLVGDAYFAEEFAHTSNLVAFALATVKGPVERASVRASARGVTLPDTFDAWFALVTSVDPERRFASAGVAVRALAVALGEPPLPEASPSLPAQRAAAAVPRVGGAGLLGDAVPDSRGDPTLVAEDGADWMAPTATASVLPSGGSGGAGGTGSAADASLAGDMSAADVSDAARRSQLSAGPHVTDAPSVPRRTTTTVSVRGRRRWAWAVGAFVAAGGVTAGVALGLRREEPAPVVVSPLEEPASVLACPIFEASGVPEPSGWLGAAAAATVCERARVILGGSAARTLVPAELLALPAQPVDHFPEDPFGQADARAKSLDAAKRRAAAYVDGHVTKERDGFKTTLALRRANGEEIGHADGQGRALYEAVRQAMDRLVSPDRLPKSKALDPTLAEWSRARSVDGALALLDVTMSMWHNAGSVADECASLAARGGEIGEMMPIEQWVCAYTLGLAAPSLPLPPLDASATPGALAARARIQHIALSVYDQSLISRLHEHFEKERSSLGRSVLAATLSCVMQASDPTRASDLARIAVHADPKNPLAEFCAPWGQLLSTTTDTASIGNVVDARQAWVPWDGNAWLETALRGGDPKRATVYARRAYVLSPFDAYVAGVLADKLLRQGAREEVRSMAITMGVSAFPVHKVESDLLLVRVDASEARFGAALKRAMSTMNLGPDDAGWVRVQRFEVAWRALEIGNVLGRASEIADLIVERFLDPEPSPLDGNNFTVALRIPAICVRASEPVSKRCFVRFRALRSRLTGGILQGTDAFTDGAESYANGDFRNAARIWKPLLREPGLLTTVLSDAMETVFERSGEQELVQRLESASTSSGAGEYNGAVPGDVRAARRAVKHRDTERARQLAQKVIGAWSVADETVPAVSEMRKLVASLR
ncbi:protein kinase domain-containing protein [Pendulispora albinea]|uniref:Serine/threonine protein kinase n=1 Tax=Pendulispora albinea TaxID=2741071 RepID=A0ABZ2LL03_9BACT